MAKSTPKIEIGTMFDKNHSLHIERIQFGKKSQKNYKIMKAVIKIISSYEIQKEIHLTFDE